MLFFLLLISLVKSDFENYYKLHHKLLTEYGISKKESELNYKENIKFIEQFNKEDHSYKMSENTPFVGFNKDKLKDIFIRRTRYNITNYQIKNAYNGKQGTIPDSIDYRNQMSSIRDQGSCASCYSFGSVGAIEGRLNLYKNNKFDFSEQQVISCSQSYGNNGCNGGLSYNVYEYILHNDLAIESDYPYTETTGTCKSVKKHIKIQSYQSCRGFMQDCLVRGPIDIAMDVTSSFNYYSSGYYSETNCNSDPNYLNHEMVAVGYGYNNGKLYYIIRNSWGKYWGMNGYAYVYAGICGVDSDPVEPNGCSIKSRKYYD